MEDAEAGNLDASRRQEGVIPLPLSPPASRSAGTGSSRSPWSYFFLEDFFFWDDDGHAQRSQTGHYDLYCLPSQCLGASSTTFQEDSKQWTQQVWSIPGKR